MWKELNEQLPHGAASASPALAITWSNGARHALVSASRLDFNVAPGARGEKSKAIRWLFEKAVGH